MTTMLYEKEILVPCLLTNILKQPTCKVVINVL